MGEEKSVIVWELKEDDFGIPDMSPEKGKEIVKTIAERKRITLDDSRVLLEKSYKILASFIEKNKEKTVDGNPCSECGGVSFLRTGTCHVCITCGSSQGCS